MILLYMIESVGRLAAAPKIGGPAKAPPNDNPHSGT